MRNLSIVAWSLASLSCSPSASKLAPYLQHLSVVERIERASLIVVGVVESERSMEWGWKTPDVERRRVRIHVEGVVKGQFEGSQLDFEYYGLTGGWNGPSPNLLWSGKRALFYLVRDGPTFRATNDAYSSNTEIVTGKHDVRSSPSSAGVREAIARLFLVPGEGMDMEYYINSLYVERARALDVVSEAEVAGLMQVLLEHPNGRIRGRACILLAAPPLSRVSCLTRLIKDLGAAPEDRRLANEMMKKRSP